MHQIINIKRSHDIPFEWVPYKDELRIFAITPERKRNKLINEICATHHTLSINSEKAGINKGMELLKNRFKNCNFILF